jgi:hypothetical protein
MTVNFSRRLQLYGVSSVGKEVKNVNYPCNRLWRPKELWGVEAPTFSDNRIRLVVRLWNLRVGRALPPQEVFLYSFLLKAESTPGL